MKVIKNCQQPNGTEDNRSRNNDCGWNNTFPNPRVPDTALSMNADIK